jgi:hypothetical protein
MKEFNDLEDLFNTEEFKALPWKSRVWLRMKVAFIQTLRMI